MGLHHTWKYSKCFERCGFQAGNEGEDGRFISFLYVCTGVTNCQKFAFLLNNKMLVTVIHYFLVLNYYNSHTGNKRRSLKFSNKLCMFFSLQKLLYRNHEYSPGFCVGFFYNKKILFSFYYVLYFRKWNSRIRAFWWQPGWGFRCRRRWSQSWFWCYCTGTLWGKHPRNYWYWKRSDYLW